MWTRECGQPAVPTGSSLSARPPHPQSQEQARTALVWGAGARLWHSGKARGGSPGRDRVFKDQPGELSAEAAGSPVLCPKWFGLFGHPAPRLTGQVACQVLLAKFPAKEGLAGGAAGGAGGGCEAWAAWHAATAQLRSRPGCPPCRAPAAPPPRRERCSPRVPVLPSLVFSLSFINLVATDAA